MVVNRESGEIEHKRFYNIVDYMRKNDLLILNNTRVFPARLFATKDRTDAKVEVFLLRELSADLWEVMVRPARKVRIGNKLVFTPKLICDVIDNTVSGGRVVRFEYDGDNFDKMIDRIGTPPCHHISIGKLTRMIKKDIKQSMRHKEVLLQLQPLDYTLLMA